MSENKTQNEQQNKQDVKIEDLPVAEEQEENVKGGPTFSNWLPA